MAGRSLKVLSFDTTSAIANAGPRPIECKYLKVHSVPNGGDNVILYRVDGGDWILAHQGDVLKACAGDAFSQLEVQSPALAGAIVFLAGNDDAIPLAGSSPASAPGSSKLLEAFWLPHLSVGAGDHMDLNVAALPGGAPFWSAVNIGGLGTMPVITVRGARCALSITNAGGSSGFIGSPSFSWQRLRAEPGAGGATTLSRMLPRMAAFNIAFDLRCEGQGNSHGGAGQGTGLQLLQGQGTAASLSGNVAGFGVVRDGAAGAGAWWRFVARAIDAGALTVDQALTKPAGSDVRKWCRFRIEIADADPIAGRDGLVNVYQNEIQVGAFNNMVLFPPSSDGANRTGLDWQVIGESLQADALTWSRGHWWFDSQVGAAE